jgi:hypothetical protein
MTFPLLCPGDQRIAPPLDELSTRSDYPTERADLRPSFAIDFAGNGPISGIPDSEQDLQSARRVWRAMSVLRMLVGGWHARLSLGDSRCTHA